jgi:hypothetical protein
MGQESLRKLFQSFVTTTPGVAQDLFDVGTQCGIAPAKSGGRLGPHRIAVIRPFEERHGSSRLIGRIRAGRERVAPRLILPVFIHESA